MDILAPVIKVFLFSVAHYLAIGLLAVVSYLIGRRLTLRWRYHSTVEQSCFCLALGLGVIAYCVLLLGLLRLLYPAAALLTLAVGVALCYPVWREWPRQLAEVAARLKRWPARRDAGLAVIVLIGLGLVLPMAMLALYPPTQHDATMYHLPYAKIFIQHHGLVPTPNLRYIAAPQTSEMLFTLAMLLYDDLLAQLTQFLMMMTTAAAMIAFAQRYFTLRVGWWAAALWLGSPLVVWLGTSAYVDVGVAFYVTMTVYAFRNWLAGREQRWLVLMGVFCGLAVGTKLLALFFFGVLGAVVLYLALKERRYGWPLAFGVITLVVALPWLARSFYYTGNPIYPLFHGTVGKALGGEVWRAEYAQGVFERVFATNYRNRLRGFFLLPWNMVFHPQRVYPGAVSHIPFAYVLAMPGVLAAFLLGARFRWLGALPAVYLPFWYYTIPDLRYLTPILPPLSLMVAVAADHLLRRLPAKHRWMSHTAVTAFGCMLVMSPGWLHTARKVYWSKWIPVNERQRDRYLTEHLPTYRLYQHLNEVKGKDYQVYAAFDEQMAYFAEGRFLGDWFGPYPFSRLIERRAPADGTRPRERGGRIIRLVDGQSMYQTLEGFGADHLLVPLGQRRRVSFPNDDFFHSHFKLTGASPHGVLYELSRQPLRLTRGPNLLQNAGFEEMDNGCPKAWVCVGQPVISVTPAPDSLGAVTTPRSIDGAEAAIERPQEPVGLVTANSFGNENFLRQSVPVTPGALYALGLKTRAAAPQQQATLQIDWTDENGVLLASDTEVVSPGTGWQTYGLRVSAPPGAANAVIYARGQGSVWFDEFELVQLKYEPKG